MDQEQLTAQLNACLLTDAEMKLGPEQWRYFPDPFSKWELVSAVTQAVPVEDPE
jgi:hypothetical protein